MEVQQLAGISIEMGLLMPLGSWALPSVVEVAGMAASIMPHRFTAVAGNTVPVE